MNCMDYIVDGVFILPNEVEILQKVEQITTDIKNLRLEIDQKNILIKELENKKRQVRIPIDLKRNFEEKIRRENLMKKKSLNQIELSKSPLFTEMEENNQCGFIEYYRDIENNIENERLNFGDIVDTNGHRHYGYSFCGKDGALVNTSRYDDYSWNIEDGVIVPLEITRYLTDTLSKYKLGENCIVIYELPFWDKTVQKYDVPKDHLYEYRFDFEESDWVDGPNGPWHLWVIKNSESEWKAKLI